MTNPQTSNHKPEEGRGYLRVRSAPALAATLLFALAVFSLGLFCFAVGLYSARTLVFVHSAQIVLIVLASVSINKLLRRRFDLFEPSTVVNMMFLLYYFVRPIYLMIMVDLSESDPFASANPARPIDYAWATGYAVIGLICFHVGYYTFVARPEQAERLRYWSRSRVNRAVIVGGAWAMASAAVGIIASGGISGTLSNIGQLRVTTAGWGYGVLGTCFFSISALLLLTDHLLGKSRKFWTTSFAIMSIGWAAIMGNRTGMFALVVSFVVIYAYVRGIRSYLRLALSSILIGILVVPIILFWGVARNMNTSVSDIAGIATSVLEKDPRLLPAVALREFNAVDSFAAMLYGGPSAFPFRYGRTYLDVALFLVPRSLWPNKPKAFSTTVGDYVNEDGNDVPPGVIGELYVNFHVFGVVAGMFLLGVLMAFIHRRAISGSFAAIAMYALLLPYFGVFLSRNFLGGGIVLLTTVLPMWPAVRYIDGSKNRKAAIALRGAIPGLTGPATRGPGAALSEGRIGGS